MGQTGRSLRRLTCLASLDAPLERKASLLVMGICPLLFHGCETQHFSATTLKSIRGECNFAIGSANRKRMCLFGAPVCKRHTFRAILHSLMATASLFQQDIMDVRDLKCNVDLNHQQHHIHGPVTLTTWSFQYIGFKTLLPARLHNLTSQPLDSPSLGFAQLSSRGPPHPSFAYAAGASKPSPP